MKLLHFNDAADLCAGIPNDWSCGDLRWTFGSLRTGAATRDALTFGRCSRQASDMAAKLIEQMEEAVITDVMDQSCIRRILPGDEGDELEMGRYQDGREDCWLGLGRTKAIKRVVRLGIQCGASWMNDEDVYIRIAATAGAAARLLTMMGFGVSITGFVTALIGSSADRSNPNNHAGVTFGIKGADEQLDLEKVLSVGCTGLSRWATWHHWDNRLGIGLGGRTGPYMYAVPEIAYGELGIDHVIAQSWIGESQKNIIEAVRLLTEAPALV